MLAWLVYLKKKLNHSDKLILGKSIAYTDKGNIVKLDVIFDTDVRYLFSVIVYEGNAVVCFCRL